MQSRELLKSPNKRERETLAVPSTWRLCPGAQACPHGLQHATPPWSSPSPEVCPSAHSLHWWCHPTIPFSAAPFCSCLQSFLASWSFPMSRLFASGGQSTGALASALVLSMNIQGWFPLECTGLITKSLIWKDHWLISPSYNVPDRSPSCLVWMFLLMVSFQYP